MQPETPILMIALQIPVLADTNVEQILEAIGQKVGDALNAIRQQQQAQAATDREEVFQREFNASVLKENLESYTDATHGDLLTSLGYLPEA